MTFTITLTSAEEDKLRAQADAAGQPLDEYAAAQLKILLAENAVPDADDVPAPGESLADALKDFIGVVDSKGKFNFSEDTGRHFGDLLVQQHKRGRKK